MPQLKDLFARLSWSQRSVLALAVVAVVGGLLALQRWNDERDFKPLVSGLAAEDAGAVAAKLKESGVEYRLRDEGSTILVASARVAEVRLELASAGLPRSGRIGFELFDKANFGASEFAEQVNYHRAIEGELERSVMSIREVEQARVHVSLAKDSLYADQRQPAKASVLVKLRHAAALSPQNVAAICQLTASAVAGLSPDQVTLVDTSGNLLNRPRAAGLDDGSGAGTHTGEGALEYRQAIERDVESKIAQTLDPLLGAGHFRSGVSAEVDWAVAEQSEEIFDPNKSVMASSQTTQDGPAVENASGVPGTASNLPRPTAKAAVAGSSTSNYSRRTENITYQTSRTVKHTRLPQGGVKKISVSVLVDHALHWEGTKRVVEAPTPAKLKVIHDLVAAAVGLNTDRGDQLVVEAFPFESTLNAEPVTPGLDQGAPAPAPPPTLLAWWELLRSQKNFALLGGVGGGAVLALVVGFVAMRRRSKQTKARLTPAIEGGKTRQIGATPQDVERQIEERLAEQAAEHSRKEAEALMTLKLPAQSTKKTEVLTKHIVVEAKKDPASMAQVIRSRLNGEYQR
jgi:flagellar M-ring protein FliF